LVITRWVSPVYAGWINYFHINHIPVKSALTNIPQTHNVSTGTGKQLVSVYANQQGS